jgi:hypothetical protein
MAIGVLLWGDSQVYMCKICIFPGALALSEEVYCSIINSVLFVTLPYINKEILTDYIVATAELSQV